MTKPIPAERKRQRLGKAANLKPGDKIGQWLILSMTGNRNRDYAWCECSCGRLERRMNLSLIMGKPDQCCLPCFYERTREERNKRFTLGGTSIVKRFDQLRRLAGSKTHSRESDGNVSTVQPPKPKPQWEVDREAYFRAIAEQNELSRQVRRGKSPDEPLPITPLVVPVKPAEPPPVVEKQASATLRTCQWLMTLGYGEIVEIKYGEPGMPTNHVELSDARSRNTAQHGERYSIVNSPSMRRAKIMRLTKDDNRKLNRKQKWGEQ